VVINGVIMVAASRYCGLKGTGKFTCASFFVSRVPSLDSRKLLTTELARESRLPCAIQLPQPSNTLPHRSSTLSCTCYSGDDPLHVWGRGVYRTCFVGG